MPAQTPARPSPTAPRLHGTFERLLVAIFLVAITVPGIGMALGIGRPNEADENRTLAPFPTLVFTSASLGEYLDALTQFFEDHFAFRQTLVRWQSWVRYEVLHVSPLPTVIRGRDGWLFYADDGAMEDYAEAPPLTDAELETWRRDRKSVV